MRRNKKDTAETILKLQEIARQHFTIHGYADCSLEEIAKTAEVTRGAVYHHFGSKKGLFKAVLELVQREVAQRLEEEAALSEDQWEQLYLGCRAFVTVAIEPENRRIMLIDGPAVLGWEEWRLMDEQQSMRLLHGQLELMQQQGYLKNVRLDAATHLLSGALNEAALWLAQIANTADASEAMEDCLQTLRRLLDGIR
ncbi:TetR/AcrR family transcriptional regulator [Paenibacillus sp. PL91]|uniref:TetR/AcrR family transcriptional regulator n=1 Tax=Paenibacillus sp. PL91 TaxID=2729538 RepID=UPI00145CF61B|nr:TetR/AcrR family transcriptional regulator [Paenibacillus sp. PL91]MBC9201141.1 TetR/AcrR family transcriptional regulator [Paenibacillus sp. PL91]